MTHPPLVKKARVLERDIERRVTRYAESRGVLAYKWVSPQNAGVCDHIYLYQGSVWFVEFKQLGEKPTPLQALQHQRLVRQGASVYLVDSVVLGKEVVDYETKKTLNRPDRAVVGLFDSR